jgi:adenylate cyclase
MTLGQLWTVAWWEYHGLMLAAVAIALVALFVELDRRRGLERFLPPNVVERVIQGDRLRLEGERRVVTVVFTDLRGSTALADTLDAESVVGIVNTYLRAKARVIVDRGGIIDKFTGDGLMAIFGAMSDAPTGARAAAAAALDIRAALAALNAERAATGNPVLKHGVGMHVGEVVLGAIGLPERSDYTAMGDTVNTASRMESLCKELGVDTVLSSDIAAQLDGTVPLRPLGEATVKGKAQPITVFTLA